MSERELRQIGKKVASELKPFLDRIRMQKADYQLFEEAYLNFQERFGRAAGIVMWLDKEYSKIPSEIYQTFIYLGIVESIGNTIVDLVIMLLVATGRDFHIECQHTTPRIKHAMTIKDLEKERVSLTTKLNFLRDNDLKTFASLIDTSLRNIIAHLKFDVKDGKVFIKGKPAPKLLTTSTRKTVEALMIAEKSISGLAMEKGLIYLFPEGLYTTPNETG